MPTRSYKGRILDVRTGTHLGFECFVIDDPLFRQALTGSSEAEAFEAGRTFVDASDSGDYQFLGLPADEPDTLIGISQLWSPEEGILFLKDGVGINHTVHYDGSAAIGKHHFPSPIALPVDNAFEWTAIGAGGAYGDITSRSDPYGRIVPDPVNGSLTIVSGNHANGVYTAKWHCSCESEAGGGSHEMIIVAMSTVFTPFPVTSTNASPTVITAVGLPPGLGPGTPLIMDGETGNTAINGSAVIAERTGDDFTIYSLEGDLIDGSGVPNDDGAITVAGLGESAARVTVSEGSPSDPSGIESGPLLSGASVLLYFAMLSEPLRSPSMWIINLSLERRIFLSA